MLKFMCLTSGVAKTKNGEASRIAEIRGRHEQLPPRELEVVGQVVRGKRNKMIVSDLMRMAIALEGC